MARPTDAGKGFSSKKLTLLTGFHCSNRQKKSQQNSVFVFTLLPRDNPFNFSFLLTVFSTSFYNVTYEKIYGIGCAEQHHTGDATFQV